MRNVASAVALAAGQGSSWAQPQMESGPMVAATRLEHAVRLLDLDAAFARWLGEIGSFQCRPIRVQIIKGGQCSRDVVMGVSGGVGEHCNVVLMLRILSLMQCVLVVSDLDEVLTHELRVLHHEDLHQHDLLEHCGAVAVQLTCADEIPELLVVDLVCCLVGEAL